MYTISLHTKKYLFVSTFIILASFCFMLGSTTAHAETNSSYTTSRTGDSVKWIENQAEQTSPDASSVHSSYSISRSSVDAKEKIEAKIQDLLKQLSDLREKYTSIKIPTEVADKVEEIKSDFENRDKVGLAICTYNWERNLTSGSRGKDVSGLQEFLKKEGLYSEDVTGYFGPVTQRAVQAFQKMHEVVKDGTPATTGFGAVGSQTRMALQKRCDKEVVTHDESYTLKDVKSVTSKYVDPIPNAADDEYTLYVIKLKDGTTFEVKGCGFCLAEHRESAFRKTGYTGDISDLLKMAKKTDDSDEDEDEDEDEEDEDTSADFEVEVSDMTATASFTLNNGCAGYIVQWGDGEKETENTKLTSRTVVCTQALESVELEHTYTEAGKYRVRFTSLSNGRKSETIVEKITIEEEETESDE